MVIEVLGKNQMGWQCNKEPWIHSEHEFLAAVKKSESRLVMSDSLWPHDCSLSGSSVHGIGQARILEFVAILFSRGSSLARDQNWVSCIADGFFTVWATRGALTIRVAP